VRSGEKEYKGVEEKVWEGEKEAIRESEMMERERQEREQVERVQREGGLRSIEIRGEELPSYGEVVKGRN